MIPIIQFDPATMSLWYDVQLIASADPSGAIANAVAHIVSGDTREVMKQLDKIGDHRLRGRGIQIVSAFWHEKRHFLDFVATNYGAFRFRQFLEVYTNLPAIIRISKSIGRLRCPLEIYDDPVRCDLMNVADPPEQLISLAKMLARRRKMIERDRRRVATRFGTMEIGGEAQLEALAYLAQSRFITKYYGAEGAKEFRDSLYNVDNFSEKYFSIIEAAARVGLIPFKITSTLSAEEKDEVVSFDSALLEATLFASLQSDYTPDTNDEAHFASSYPGERFAAIGMKILEDHPTIAKRTPGSIRLEEAWELVDRACTKVFGYSVPDQIERDIAHFEKQHSKNIVGRTPEDIETISRDYLALRRRVLDRLRTSPISIFSTELFALSTVDQVLPNYVICTSNGQIGDPPQGYNRLIGYREPDRDVEKFPYLKWWWACSPNHDDDKISGDVSIGPPHERLQFEHSKSWYSCIDFYAPTSKLLMNGRRIRTMLGPELMFAEQRLETQFGLTTDIYPSFEFPDETIDPGVFYFYYGVDTLKCDFSSAMLHKPEGKVLTPWTIRRWPRLARRIIEKMGGHEIAYYTFVRDWTPWMVSNEVFADLKSFMS